MSYLGVGTGIGEGGELTSAEEVFVQNLAGISYVLGDVIYYDGNNLTRLGIGSSGQVLKVTAGVPAWGEDNSTASGVVTVTFKTISTPRGTSPEAESATDTLTFTEGEDILITGDQSNDSVTFAKEVNFSKWADITLTEDTTIPSGQNYASGTLDLNGFDLVLNGNIRIDAIT